MSSSSNRYGASIWRAKGQANYSHGLCTFIGVTRKINNTGHRIINIFNFMVVRQFAPLRRSRAYAHVNWQTESLIFEGIPVPGVSLVHGSLIQPIKTGRIRACTFPCRNVWVAIGWLFLVHVLFIRGGKGLKTRGYSRCEASDWLASCQSTVNHRV